MKTKIFMIAVVTALGVFFATGIFQTLSLTRFGMIILTLGCIAVDFALIRSIKKQKQVRLVGAKPFDDPKDREKNRKNGLAAFSLLYSDGSRKVVTVKERSDEYNFYQELAKKDLT